MGNRDVEKGSKRTSFALGEIKKQKQKKPLGHMEGELDEKRGHTGRYGYQNRRFKQQR